MREGLAVVPEEEEPRAVMQGGGGEDRVEVACEEGEGGGEGEEVDVEDQLKAGAARLAGEKSLKE